MTRRLFPWTRLLGWSQRRNAAAAPWRPAAVRPVDAAAPAGERLEGRVLLTVDYVQSLSLDGAGGDRLGVSMAALGDVDGDGVADLAIGSHFADPNGNLSGSIRVVSGARAEAGRTIYTVGGLAAEDRFGVQMAAVGDQNGDGISELAVTAERSDHAGPDFGSVTVLDGATGAARYRIDGESDAAFGESLSGLGDVDGDGIADFAIGDRFGLVGGVASGYVTIRSGADGSELARLTGDPGDQFGQVVHGGPDVTGDGVADFVVSARLDDAPGRSAAGSVTLYDGQTLAAVWTVFGAHGGEAIGWNLQVVGDVSGDGVADVAVTSPWDDSTLTDTGLIRLLSGTDGSTLYDLRGTVERERLGRGPVIDAGDVDGDGRDDLITGAIYHSPSGLSEAGRVVVRSGVDGSPLYQSEGTAAAAWLGWSLASLGDVDGDGRTDFAAGASQQGGSRHGRVQFYHSDTTPQATDLVLRDVSVVDAANVAVTEWASGVRIAVEVTYEVTGTAPVDPFDFGVSVDGVEVRVAGETTPGVYRQVVLTELDENGGASGGWYKPEGDYAVSATLDLDDTVAEADESNNAGAATLAVRDALIDIPVQFGSPFTGAFAKDYAIGGGLDVDPRADVLSDYRGHRRGYDGHTGWDAVGTSPLPFDSWGPSDQLDAGVPIFAVADGVVTRADDGAFDRNGGGVSRPGGNGVNIDHGNGWSTGYGHLARDSVAVAVGQLVRAGDLLGYMASSGGSTGPHLHFGVSHNGRQVETGYAKAIFWGDTPIDTIDNPDAVRSFTVTGDDTMRDPGHDRVSLADLGLGERPVGSIMLMGAKAETVYQLRWLRPDGEVADVRGWTFPGWRSRSTVSHLGPVIDELGTWTAQFVEDGTVLAERRFEAVPVGSAIVRILDAADPETALNNNFLPSRRTTPLEFGGEFDLTRTLYIHNRGQSPLTFSLDRLPDGFSLDRTAVTVAPDGVETIIVSFDPNHVGRSHGDIIFATNDPNHPEFRLTLEGFGQDAANGVSGSPLPLAQTFDQGPTPAVVDPLAAVDTGGALVTRLEVAIDGGFEAGEDRLSAVSGGSVLLSGTAVFVNGVSVGTVTQSDRTVDFDLWGATAADAGELLRSVRFSSTSGYSHKRIVRMSAETAGGVAVAPGYRTILLHRPHETVPLPAIVPTQWFDVVERTANGTAVGQIAVGGTQDDRGWTFAITDQDIAGALAIDAATGTLRVADSSLLDEMSAPNPIGVRIAISEPGVAGVAASGTVYVGVIDGNDPPRLDDITFDLAENAAAGTVVGTLAATDPDPGQTISYAIVGGTGSGALAIDAATGRITVTDPSALDFETAPILTLDATATDDGAPPLSDAATVTIRLGDENEAPVAPDRTFELSEAAPLGWAVGMVAASDPDAGQTITFAIVGGNAGAFAINGMTGLITVADPARLDFETMPRHTLMVSATDDGVPSLSDTATITIDLLDAVEPDPPVIDRVSSSVRYVENRNPNYFARAARVFDADTTDFGGAVLTVGIDNGLPEDFVGLRDGGGVLSGTPTFGQGTGVVQIAVSGVGVFDVADVVYGGSSMTLTFRDGTTAAQITQILRRAAYWNDSESPDASARTIRVRLTDPTGAASAGGPGTESMIRIVSVADPTQIAGFDASPTWTEGGGAVGFATSGGLTVTDVDTADFGGSRLDVVVRTPRDAGDVFVFDPDADAAVAISGTAAGSVITIAGRTVATLVRGSVANRMVLDLAGGTTASDLTRLIGLIRFDSASDAPRGPKRIAVTIFGGDGARGAAIVSLAVTGVNDPPAILGVAGEVAPVTAGESPRRIATRFAIADPDYAGGGGTLQVAIASPPAGASLTLAADPAGRVAIDGSDVLYRGTVVGIATGLGTASLRIDFGAAASVAAVRSVGRLIAFAAESTAVPGLYDTVWRFADEGGLAADPATMQIDLRPPDALVGSGGSGGRSLAVAPLSPATDPEATLLDRIIAAAARSV